MNKTLYLKADGGWTTKRSAAVRLPSDAEAKYAVDAIETGHCSYCLFMRDLSVMLVNGICPVCKP